MLNSLIDLNYTHTIFYIIIPISMMISFVLIHLLVYIDKKIISLKYLNYFYIIFLSYLLFLSKDYYVEHFMGGEYFSSDDPERFSFKDEVKHQFYLSLIFKFYLSIMLTLIIFNKASFKFKTFINTLALLWCFKLSLHLGIQGGIFLEETFIPAFLFYIEFALYIFLYKILQKMRLKFKKNNEDKGF